MRQEGLDLRRLEHSDVRRREGPPKPGAGAATSRWRPAGGIDLCTSVEVLQEILHRYVGLKRPDLAAEVYELFIEVCPVVFPVTLPDTGRAKSMIGNGVGVSVRDAIHAAVMLNNKVTQIATFDAGFDNIHGLKRLDLP